MSFNEDYSHTLPSFQAEYARYRYHVEYTRPKFEIVKEPYRPLQPFDKQDTLVDRIFTVPSDRTADPFMIPMQRADLHHRQIDIMLELLGSRHAISYQIRKDIESEECHARAKLYELESRPMALGRESRFASELVKQLQHLQQERHAENVACWRDTSRLLSDICEHWTEYADESRKARLMQDGL